MQGGGMKQLDGLLERINKLYFPIYVKGKEYPGNNPYILNKINNMLMAGWIKGRFGVLNEPADPLQISDLSWDDKRLYYDEKENCLFYHELAQVSFDINDETNRLCGENDRRLAGGI